MKYQADIQAASTQPQLLEELYQTAQRENGASEFKADMLACYESKPDNLLFAAWYYRLQQATAQSPEKKRKSINWILAVPLGILTGLIFWSLSDARLELVNHIPYLFVLWAPVATIFALCFLVFSAKTHYRRLIAIGIPLAVLVCYAVLISLGQRSEFQQRYLELMIVHLPLISWVGIGLCLLGWKSTMQARFAFLIKSIEVMITAGIYLIAGIAFGTITIGLFSALSITLPDVVIRLIVAGGIGLIPIIAVASVYDPSVGPDAQDFSQGLSKFITTLMRLLLPLTLIVLVVYIFIIPFNFMQPFNNRDVLIVYNVMLFAIMGLLIGATPMRADELSPKVQSALRSGILAVAALAILVSLYALSAVIYRTVEGGITINRITIIGWNTINIAILVGLIFKQIQARRQAWIENLRWIFGIGTNAYLIWTVFLIIVIPLIFR
jgi:hypothetical protein